MTTKANQCQYCGEQKDVNVTAEQLERIKKNKLVICKNCSRLMKVNVDEKTNKVSSFEKYTTPISFSLHSALLNQDLPYLEQLMPDSDCENLREIIKELKQNTTLANPIDANSITFKDKNANVWIANNVLPQLVPMYNAYPLQVVEPLRGAGLAKFLDPYATLCPICGLGIPKAKQGNCPFCKNAIIQEKKTPEDPLTRRLRFLISEREQKCAELEQIVKQTKSARTSGILHALTGDAQTTILQMQQMNARAQDIQSEIRKIDFEIQQLQSEMTNKSTQSVAEEKMFCRYCEVQNETDAVFCKKCGKKIA